MDKITKQVNIETLKSHTPGILPYIPYGGDAFTTSPEGNWGGFPINYKTDFEGTIVVVDRALKTPNDIPSFISVVDYEDNDLGCAMCGYDYVQLYVFICGKWEKFFGYKGNVYQTPDNEFVLWNDELKRWEYDDEKQKENKKTYEPYLTIISRFHKLQQIIDSGIKVKQIREGSNKYTPRFEENFVVNGDNIVSIEEFFVGDRFLYNIKEESEILAKPYFVLISQEDYENYCKLGGFTEYKKISDLLGILIIDNTIEGDLVPNFLYFSSINTYIDELKRYKSGDCCNRKKYAMMGGDAMLTFLENWKMEYEPLDFNYDEDTEYFYLPISEEIYKSHTVVDSPKSFTAITSSNRESGELSAWAKMNEYVNNITGEIKKTSDEYLHAITRTYDKSGKLVFEYHYFFKKNWRSPLMPVINVSLALTQNSDDLGVLSVYESEDTVITEYKSKDGNISDIPYFETNEGLELAKTKRISYDGGLTWKEESCWYGWELEEGEELETYHIESKLQQLRTREKIFNDNGELLSYITKGEKNVPPFKDKKNFKDFDTFNDVYLYSYHDPETGIEKRVYSCDYIQEIVPNEEEGTIDFIYCIGAEYILDGEPEAQCDIGVYGNSGGKEILIHKVSDVPSEGESFNLKVDSSCPWSLTIIYEDETFLQLYDSEGNEINPNSTITVDSFLNTTTLRVATSTNWNMGAEKCTLSPRSGKGDANVTLKIVDTLVGGETLVINYGKNYEHQNRYFLSTDSDKKIEVFDETGTIPITEIDAKAEAADIRIKIESNTSWSVGTSGGWSDAYQENGEHTYDNPTKQQTRVTVIVHVNENYIPIEREEKLIITSGTYILQIPLIQAAAEYVSVYDLDKSKDEATNYLSLNSVVPVDELKQWVETNVSSGWTLDEAYENEDPYLYVSDTHFEFDNTDQLKNLTILTNADSLVIDVEYKGRAEGESYDVSDSWCNLTPEGRLTVKANRNNENRYCTIHVYAKTADKEDVEYKIQIIQKA